MGFHSNICNGCSHSILSPYVTEDGRGPVWMYRVHLVEPDGREVAGVYDGYGRIVTLEYLRDFKEVMSALKSLFNAEPGNPAMYGVECDPKKGYASVGDLRHYACWQAAGEPGFEHGSRHSEDQGFFGSWKGLKKPASQDDLAKLRKKSERAY